MRTFFQDSYIDKVFFSFVKREVEKEQLSKTIEEINYLNELQINLLKRNDLAQARNQQLGLIKKFNNVRKTNI